MYLYLCDKIHTPQNGELIVFDHFVGLALKGLRFIMHQPISQLTFTCSKSTIETVEKGVKYVQS